LILMDIKMPILDGYQATHLLRTKYKLSDIPIIALTASAMKQEKEKIRSTGFSSYLLKPVKSEDLMQKIIQSLPKKLTSEQTSKDKSTELKKNAVGINKYINLLNEQSIYNKKSMHVHLQQILIGSWQQAYKSGLIDEIETFSLEIEKLGIDNKLLILEQYGKDLQNSVNSFDSEKMIEILNYYPQLIKLICD